MKPLHTHQNSVTEFFGQIGKFVYLTFLVLLFSGGLSLGASIILFEQMPDETNARKFLVLWALFASAIVAMMIRYSRSPR